MPIIKESFLEGVGTVGSVLAIIVGIIAILYVFSWILGFVAHILFTPFYQGWRFLS